MAAQTKSCFVFIVAKYKYKPGNILPSFFSLLLNIYSRIICTAGRGVCVCVCVCVCVEGGGGEGGVHSDITGSREGV